MIMCTAVAVPNLSKTDKFNLLLGSFGMATGLCVSGPEKNPPVFNT